MRRINPGKSYREEWQRIGISMQDQEGDPPIYVAKYRCVRTNECGRPEFRECWLTIEGTEPLRFLKKRIKRITDNEAGTHQIEPSKESTKLMKYATLLGRYGVRYEITLEIRDPADVATVVAEREAARAQREAEAKAKRERHREYQRQRRERERLKSEQQTIENN